LKSVLPGERGRVGVSVQKKSSGSGGKRNMLLCRKKKRGGERSGENPFSREKTPELVSSRKDSSHLARRLDEKSSPQPISQGGGEEEKEKVMITSRDKEKNIASVTCE